MSRLTALVLLALALSVPVWAATPQPEDTNGCFTPKGVAGQLIYSSSNKNLLFCNDAIWVPLGNPNAGGGSGPCSNPTGAEGKVIYNTNTNVLQYCNGDTWVNMGADNAGVATDCSGPAGPRGKVIYNTNLNLLQYCNGSGWVNAGRWRVSGTPIGPGCTWSLGTFVPDPTYYTNGVYRGVLSVSISADGSKMLFVTLSNQLFYSANGGTSWSELTTPNTPLNATISADGSTILLLSSNLYKSTDGGTTWNSIYHTYVNAAAISTDATRIAIAVAGDYIYLSSDGGTKWLKRENSGARTWVAVAISDDGLSIAALVDGTNPGSGSVFTSTDSGGRWTQQATIGSSLVGVSMSANGDQMVAYDNSHAYVSTNGGVSWTSQLTSPVLSGMSFNGASIAAAQYNDAVYVTANSGVSWSKIPGSDASVDRRYSNAAISRNGTRALIGTTGTSTTGIFVAKCQ